MRVMHQLDVSKQDFKISPWEEQDVEGSTDSDGYLQPSSPKQAANDCRYLLFFLAGSTATLLGVSLLWFVIGVKDTTQQSTEIWRSPGWGLEEFQDLGEGLCTNIAGRLIEKFNTSTPLHSFESAEVTADGQSPECKNRCLRESRCTGFNTHYAEGTYGSCSLLLEDEDYYPSSADGTKGFRCFWKHRYQHDSISVYDSPQKPIPKLMWSYWQVMENAKASSLLDFIGLCKESFTRLNPDWEVRVLDQNSVWRFVNRTDLPEAFDKLSIQHQSDAIRLALLVRYGGVWLDASTLLLKPFGSFLGSNPNVRTFYVNDGLVGQPVINPKFHERRYSSAFHVENWFYAAPPNDPLLVRTFECVKKFHEVDDTTSMKEVGLFTQRQLEDLDTLGIWRYLATDACMFKVLDEDLALHTWWLSPNVRRINFLGHLEPEWFANPSEAQRMLFKDVNQEMVEVLTKKLNLLKLTGDMRYALINPTPLHDLFGCSESSWSQALKATGLFNASKCHFSSELLS